MIYSTSASRNQVGESRLRVTCLLFATAAGVIFAFAGFSWTTRAHAQEDIASCEDKCSNDQKQCIHNESSEELCDYDYKMCKKACSEKK